jgi:NAD(P)-dependent dehydrogenase (short-subunit alcohol dehydrogenase family)
MSDLKGKSALVTGGAAGIGRAIVERLASDGCIVTIADIDDDLGVRTAREVGAAFVRTDVTEAASLEHAIDFSVREVGRLDLLVNNAGIVCPKAALHECGLEDWRRVLEVDLTGVFLGMKYGIAQFLRQSGGGAVVNLASVSGITGQKLIAPYAAAKAGVIALTRAAALEYAAHRIRVNAVAPTATLTSMVEQLISSDSDPAAYRKRLESFNPLPGMPEPSDIASAVAFLAGGEAKFITGIILPVDGGYTA